MKNLRYGWLLDFALALSTAILVGGCAGTSSSIVPELKRLQGRWDGEGAGGPCSVTIRGDSLHYRAGTNWWTTTITLPAGSEPRRLNARITETSGPKSGVGTVVFAIYRIEDGVLTLAVADGSETPPESFETAPSRYVVRRGRRS